MEIIKSLSLQGCFKWSFIGSVSGWSKKCVKGYSSETCNIVNKNYFLEFKILQAEK